MRSSDEAVNSVLPFIIALGLFAAAFGSIVAFSTDRIGGERTTHAPSLTVEAESLADVLVGSPGVGWEEGPDLVDRIGFQRPDGNGIDLERVQALREAKEVADPTNGKVDYLEALEGLNLPTDGSAGFHVRVRAVGAADGAFVLDPSLVRTAYVGDWPVLPTVTVALGTEQEMIDAARDELEALVETIVPEERARLRAVGVDFDDRIHVGDGPDVQVDVAGVGFSITALVSTNLLEGDVYPDDGDYLRAVLADRLPEYDLVVVGSDVDHNALSSNAVKDAVRDWVLSGGVLMVLGSDQQSDPWLKPLFNDAEDLINQQAVVPDTQSPALNSPHDLDWTEYDDHGWGWDLDQGGEPSPEHYTRIVVNDGLDVLSVSGDGVYGDGRVMLTSFQPGQIATEQGFLQAEWFFDNLLHYTLGRAVDMDYGPTPPDDATVGSAVRVTQAWDDLAGLVPVEVQVLVWGYP